MFVSDSRAVGERRHSGLCERLGCTGLCPPDELALESAHALAHVTVEARELHKAKQGPKGTATSKRSQKALQQLRRHYIDSRTDGGRLLYDQLLIIAGVIRDPGLPAGMSIEIKPEVRVKALKLLGEWMAGRLLTKTVEHSGTVRHVQAAAPAESDIDVLRLSEAELEQLEAMARKSRTEPEIEDAEVIE